MRSLRRNIMVVAGVLGVAVAAGPTLARSLPFADRSQPPTTRNATQAAATGQRLRRARSTVCQSKAKQR